MRVQRHDLARLLAATVKVVEARNTIAVLSTVKLVASDGVLVATATDLDIEIRSECGAEGGFEACIDAKLLTSIVSKVGGDEITIEKDDDGQATLRAGKSRFKLPILPVVDFPTLQHGEFKTHFDADLSSLFAPIHFAMSNEETRHYLNGIYLHVVDGKLAACATDGHRMAAVTGAEANTFAGVIIPRKLVPIIPAGLLGIDLSDGKIRLTAGVTVITSRLVEGTYPDYERVFPKTNDKIVTFDADELRGAAQRVALIASERGTGVRLSVTTDGINLWLRGTGEATDSVAGEYEGDKIDVGINSQYLADILTNMPDGATEMALFDASSPILFTGKAAPNLRIVGMPMRV